jgi:hypothetical protein
LSAGRRACASGPLTGNGGRPAFGASLLNQSIPVSLLSMRIQVHLFLSFESRSRILRAHLRAPRVRERAVCQRRAARAARFRPSPHAAARQLRDSCTAAVAQLRCRCGLVQLPRSCRAATRQLRDRCATAARQLPGRSGDASLCIIINCKPRRIRLYIYARTRAQCTCTLTSTSFNFLYIIIITTL